MAGGRPPTRRGDHPRSRGEHRVRRRLLVRLVGSSPLARGARDLHPHLSDHLRIIPARAGSTRGLSGTCRRSGDHPRSRGEHRPVSPRSPLSPGSSPLARGARVRDRRVRPRPGIIPARAGSTSRMRRMSRSLRDHPRSRGEHGLGQRHLPARARIIPARAGSTFRERSRVRPVRDHPRSRGEHLPATGFS